MRPLVSPVVEYRLMGIAELLGGVAFALVALVVEEPVAAVVGLLLAGAVFGTLMYLLAYRRFARRAVVEPAAPPTADRETAGRTRRRVALTTTALLVFLAAVAALFDAALVGGIVAGNGAALLLTSRWLRNWEMQHQSLVLREPRWRWSREGRRGWGRGRGTMDPQDFYVVASAQEAPRVSPAVGARGRSPDTPVTG